MIINSQIRTTLQEISKKAIDYANTPGGNYAYLRRILKVYDKQLTEEERIFLFTTMLELVHYRSVMVDPDNLLILSNIKLRTYMFIFFLSTIFMIVVAALFKTNSSLNGLFEMVSHFIALFSL